jgi:cysteinyl-tRNA synthetase
MSRHYLGGTFDIHGGGEDLIFPHHENEIAQSEGATGKPLANYWIHNGFVRINSEKMSKSLGNIFTICDILGRYHPEVLRLFMLQSHYKSPVDFSDDALAEARTSMERLYSTLKSIGDIFTGCDDFSGVTVDHLSGADRDLADRLTALPDRFTDAMDDDFATPRAIGHLFDIARLVNGYLGDKTFSATAEACFVLDMAHKNIREAGHVLGLFLEDPDDYFRKDRDREAEKRGLEVDEIDRLIEERYPHEEICYLFFPTTIRSVTLKYQPRSDISRTPRLTVFAGIARQEEYLKQSLWYLRCARLEADLAIRHATAPAAHLDAACQNLRLAAKRVVRFRVKEGL